MLRSFDKAISAITKIAKTTANVIKFRNESFAISDSIV